MKREKSKADFQPRRSLVVVLMLAAVIFIPPLYWAVESGRQVTAITTPPPLPPAALSPFSDQGKAIFEEKCMGCHSIGKGKLVGPDLKAVTSLRDRKWLIQFITSPDKLIAEDDPIASQLFREYGGIAMPNMGLSESDAEKVLAYIEAQSEGKPAAPPETAPAPSGDASTGRAIFTGKVALKNGGAACISCHNVSGIGTIGGGSVGRSLTNAYASFGEAGLISLMKSTPLPMMRDMYAGQPLTEGEIADLVAFLREAGREEPAQSQNRNILIIISTGVFLFILGIFQFSWRGRLSGVRQRLVRGGPR